MDPKPALRAFREANDALGSVGVKYWADCGTLLGMVRDKRIMRHDLDIDFSCWSPERHEEIQAAMEDAGFHLHHTYGTPEHGFEQAFKRGSIKVDVFYFYPGTVRFGEIVVDEALCWQGSWYREKGQWKLIVSEFDHLIVARQRKRTFNGVSVPVPVQPIAMLVARYGPKWRRRVVEWDWKRDPFCITPESHPDYSGPSIPPEEVSLGEVTAIIKTFMRPELVVRAVESVQKTYPEMEIIVVDDSGTDISERLSGVRYLELPYDSGLSAGRNAGVREVTTPYTFIMDDDMILSARSRLPDMLKLLEHGDLVCGSMTMNRRVVNWEGTYEFPDDGGLHLVKYRGPINKTAGIRWAPVDFGLNILMARTEFFREHQWDEELKTSEHTDYFLRLREAGAKVVFAPNCIVDHKPHRTPAYRRMRHRKEFRLRFFAKYGFTYHLGYSGHRDVWKPSDQAALEALLKESA